MTFGAGPRSAKLCRSRLAVLVMNGCIRNAGDLRTERQALGDRDLAGEADAGGMPGRLVAQHGGIEADQQFTCGRAAEERRLIADEAIRRDLLVPVMIAGEEAELDAADRRIAPADVEHREPQATVVHVARGVGKLELAEQKVAIDDFAVDNRAETGHALDEKAGRLVVDPGEQLAAVRIEADPVERRGRNAEKRTAIGKPEFHLAAGVPVARADFENEWR